LARYFFAGGQMAACQQLLHFQDDLAVEGHWRVSGRHYARTVRAWLGNLDRHRKAVRSVFEAAYGERAGAMIHRWRAYLLGCAELWGFRAGTEWFVSHYRLRRRGS
jgi:cyclopropane-fatty-acyl-phospholipid synthase